MKTAMCCLLVLLVSQTNAQDTREKIVGSGEAATETRSVDDFHKILVQGGAKLNIEVGKSQKLELTIDDNLMEYVTTDVEEEKLTIGWKPKTRISTKLGLTVTLQVPKLTELSIEGAADTTIKNAAGPNLAVDLSGAGSVKASGDVDNITIAINGSGNLDLEKLVTKKATVKIDGSGDVLVDARDSLVVSISGSGDVRYVGEPSITRTVSGSGNVSKKKDDTEK